MLRPDPVLVGAVPLAAGRRSLLPAALFILALAAASILGALAFEHIGGYQPCALCLMQRTPYYIGIPVAAGLLLALWLAAPRVLLVLLFAALGVLFLYNAGLAAYHSGVEWGFWEGPAACAPTVGVSGVEDMLDQLENERAPSCTEAVWRLLGLSFAGWNVLISAVLAALGIYGARRAWQAA